MAALDDLLLGSGNKYTLIRGFDTLLTGNNNDKIQNSIFPYYQGGALANRRAYVSTTAHAGSKAVKFVLTPVGQTNLDGVVESESTANQVWNSGLGLGHSSIVGRDCIEGDEIWASAYIYLSSNWSWAPNNGSSLKLLRLAPSSYYEGELVIGCDLDGQIKAATQNYTGTNSIILECGANGGLYGAGSDASLSGPLTHYPIGSWFRLDAYLKISSNPALAMARVWINGTLTLARNGNTSPYAGAQTLNRSGNAQTLGSPGVVIYSTWDVDGNSSGPTLPNGQQYILYDDIVVTNDPTWIQANGEQDAAGNWMIGNAQATPDLSSLRNQIKSQASINGYHALAEALARSPIQIPNASTDSEKIVHTLVPLLAMSQLYTQGYNDTFGYPGGKLNSRSFPRLAQGHFNLVHAVNDRIYQLYQMADSASNESALQSILDTEVSQGWP